MNNKKIAKELVKMAKKIIAVGNSIKVTPLRKEIIKAVKSGKTAFNEMENFQKVIENLKVKIEENRYDSSSNADLEIDDENLEKLLNKLTVILGNFYFTERELEKF